MTYEDDKMFSEIKDVSLYWHTKYGRIKMPKEIFGITNQIEDSYGMIKKNYERGKKVVDI